ncbi:MAG: PDC sensor domain-containing protein [Acidithiobacillus ferrivorans]
MSVSPALLSFPTGSQETAPSDGWPRLIAVIGLPRCRLANIQEPITSWTTWLAELRRADALQHPRRARTLLLDYLKATSEIASANLIAPNGHVIASTAVPAGKPLLDFRNNPAIWQGFQKVLQAHGMRVYHPLRGPLVGSHWVIRLSRTVFSPTGKPLFVVATPLRFNGIEDFLSH